MSALAGKLLEGALFAAGQYLILGLLALAAYLFGRRLSARLDYHSRLEALSFSLALGLGAISYLIMLLGLAGLLEAWLLLGAMAIGALACRQVWRDWPGRLRAAMKRGVGGRRALLLALLLGALAIVLMPGMALALYPPSAWDATAYHLAAAKIYVEHGALVFTPYLRFPVFPQVNQMLFAGALLVDGEVLAHQIEWLMTMALAAAMIALAGRRMRERAGWWAAAMLLGTPLVVRLATVAYVDAGLLLYLFLTCCAFLNWRAERRLAWLVVAGVCGGLAVGIKYTAIFFVLALALWALAGRRIAPPLIFGGTAFLAVAPWLARNIYYAGNPLFPFFTGLFTPLFGEREVRLEDFQTMNSASLGIGIGRSLQSLLSLPWEMATNQDAFIPEAPIPSLFVALLLLGVVFAARQPKLRGLLLLALGYTVFWFYGYQLVRYLLPAYPIYCLLAAGGLDSLCSRFKPIDRLDQLAGAGRNEPVGGIGRCYLRGRLTLLVGLLLLSPGWWYAVRLVKQNGRIPVNAEQRDIHLRLAHESYPLYKFLNEQTGGRYRLYALHERHMAYFADGEFLGDGYGPARYDLVIGKMDSGESLLAALRAMDVDFLLVNFAYGEAPLPGDEAFSRYFRPLFRRVGSVLYDLRPQPFSVETGANLVADAGAPEHEVKLAAGRYYRLGFTARGSAGGRARLQVRWLDARGNKILNDLQVCTASPAAMRQEIDFLAPASASAAIVTAGPDEGSQIECRDLFFGELLFGR